MKVSPSMFHDTPWTYSRFSEPGIDTFGVIYMETWEGFDGFPFLIIILTDQTPNSSAVSNGFDWKIDAGRFLLDLLLLSRPLFIDPWTFVWKYRKLLNHVLGCCIVLLSGSSTTSRGSRHKFPSS